ncbi:MAG TPA: sulfurtransferase/chromate resistance protein [Allosphingosinicella sp.]|nr:sulfurtransferase/chromate resistance protein [Allosphingosinicella sp.]
MPTINAITPDKLARLIGTPACPALIDLTESGDFIPGARRRDAHRVSDWADVIAAPSAIVICRDGAEASPAIAAWLRQAGIRAEILEGGMAAWAAAGLPLVREAVLPPRDAGGRTRWVTRARPKVDRIACPWLIRRFVDPAGIFLFVAPNEVPAVGERLDAAPFDVDGVFWSHRGDQCSFDTMIAELGLSGMPALSRLATIVRGADTARPELAPQAAGLLAVSLGLSRMHADDLEQLEAGMIVYDALFRWCRDAVDETHDWVSHSPKARVKA